MTLGGEGVGHEGPGGVLIDPARTRLGSRA